MEAVFVETTIFEKIRPDYLDDKSYLDLQLALMATPKSGDVIQKTGGIRKVRWSAKGKGKRSGVRIIYYWLDAKDRFYILTLGTLHCSVYTFISLTTSFPKSPAFARGRLFIGNLLYMMDSC